MLLYVKEHVTYLLVPHLIKMQFTVEITWCK